MIKTALAFLLGALLMTLPARAGAPAAIPGTPLGVTAYCLSDESGLQPAEGSIEELARIMAEGSNERYVALFAKSEICYDHRFFGSGPVHGELDAKIDQLHDYKGRCYDVWRVRVSGRDPPMHIFTWIKCPQDV